MEWSIQDIARSAGTTSRTLRHYDDIGLLEPSRVGANGYRYYDEHALVRLQRILLLRELGLGLPAIAEVFEGQRDTAAALRTHLKLLAAERERIGRQKHFRLHMNQRGSHGANPSLLLRLALYALVNRRFTKDSVLNDSAAMGALH